MSVVRDNKHHLWDASFKVSKIGDMRRHLWVSFRSDDIIAHISYKLLFVEFDSRQCCIPTQNSRR